MHYRLPSPPKKIVKGSLVHKLPCYWRISIFSRVIMSAKDVAIAVRSVAWGVKGRVKEKQNSRRRHTAKEWCLIYTTGKRLIREVGRWLDPKDPPTVLVCIFHSSSGAITQASATQGFVASRSTVSLQPLLTTSARRQGNGSAGSQTLVWRHCLQKPLEDKYIKYEGIWRHRLLGGCGHIRLLGSPHEKI